MQKTAPENLGGCNMKIVYCIERYLFLFVGFYLAVLLNFGQYLGSI